jgi:alpha-L-arabinofuranosidase
MVVSYRDYLILYIYMYTLKLTNPLGIRVDSSWKYNVSFYYRFPTSSNYTGSAVVSLTGASGTVYGTVEHEIKGSQTSWTQVNLSLTPKVTAPTTNNSFTVSIPNAGGETIHFAMFSLFPPTFKNRENGMRIDLAESLINTGHGVFRFPGGNNIVCEIHLSSGS